MLRTGIYTEKCRPLLVKENGNLIGLVTREEILRFLKILK
jgi:predicted transcriptional regulator